MMHMSCDIVNLYGCVFWFLDVWELNCWMLGIELEYPKQVVSHYWYSSWRCRVNR